MSEPVNEAVSVELRLTLEQAAAVSQACELLTRLGIGQIEYLAEQVRFDAVRPYTNETEPERGWSDPDRCERIDALCRAIKRELGLSANASRGIGHKHNPLPVRRAYEVQKVVDKALAEHRNPNPSFRTVNYDGLGPRYTTDPAPVAFVSPVPLSSAGKD
jgi:hypothetical protein